MNFDSSKTSSPDCIPVVVLKNCKAELSFIPAELFNMCLKESSVVPLFKNVGETSTAKSYRPVSLLSLVLWSLKNLEIIGFPVISSMVLGLLDQLQIF